MIKERKKVDRKKFRALGYLEVPLSIFKVKLNIFRRFMGAVIIGTYYLPLVGVPHVYQRFFLALHFAATIGSFKANEMSAYFLYVGVPYPVVKIIKRLISFGMLDASNEAVSTNRAFRITELGRRVYGFWRLQQDLIADISADALYRMRYVRPESNVVDIRSLEHLAYHGWKALHNMYSPFPVEVPEVEDLRPYLDAGENLRKKFVALKKESNEKLAAMSKSERDKYFERGDYLFPGYVRDPNKLLDEFFQQAAVREKKE